MGQKRILIAAFAAAFLGTMAFRISIPAVAFYTRNVLKGTMLELGLLTSSFFTARAVSAVAAGKIADKARGLHLLISSCFLIHSAIVFLYVLASSWAHVMLLRALQGILNGLAWVSVQFVLGSSVEAEVRGRAYSAYFLSGSFGSLAGNLVFSAMASAPMEDVMSLSAIMFALTAIASLFLAGPGGRANPRPGQLSRSSSGAGASGHLLAWTCLMVFGSRALNSLLMGDVIYIYLSEVVGMGPSLASALVGSAALIGLAASMPVSWLADKKGDGPALSLAVGLASAGALMFPLRHPAPSVTGYILLVIGTLSLVPLVRKLAMTYQRERGLALGLVNAVGNVGTASGSILLGSALEALGTSTILFLGLELLEAVLIVSLSLLAVVGISVLWVRRALRGL